MSQYFDKDFFKFLISFVSILIIGLVSTAFLREYQSRLETKPATPKVYATAPQP